MGERGPPRHLEIARYRRARRGGYELVCVLQSDAVGGPERIAAPLLADAPPGVLLPEVSVGGERHRVVLRAMTPVPLRLLGEVVGDAASARGDITRGLDLLFLGV